MKMRAGDRDTVADRFTYQRNLHCLKSARAAACRCTVLPQSHISTQFYFANRKAVTICDHNYRGWNNGFTLKKNLKFFR
jgi:hypothetical protein